MNNNTNNNDNSNQNEINILERFTIIAYTFIT